MKPFKSTHDLPFETCPWNTPVGKLMNTEGTLFNFRVGTCQGLYDAGNEKSYDVIFISNAQPGNGHLDDVLEWFENSCKRDKKDLIVREVWNEGFKKHLIEKRGFQHIGEDDVIKHFR